MRNRYGPAIARPSHIRPAVAELLTNSDRHDWSIEELTTALAEDGVSADFSSVFRAVSRLVEEGSISRIDLGDGKARYEPATDHHEHVRCEECGRVEAFHGCLVQKAIPAVERETGFAISGHQLLFLGLCSACGAKGGA